MPSKFFKSRDMQCRDSLGVATKIPRLSTGTTGKFKTRHSRSTIGSASDVFADEVTTRGQAGLSVSGIKLRSEKNLNGDEGRLPSSRGPRRARRGLWTGGS